jgi:hypothetical protein
MSRLYSLGTWSFSSVAIALAVLVPLTVPEGALADSGQTCYENCQSSCYNQCGNDPNCIEQCMGPCGGSCCVSACNGDPNCMYNCCAEVCGNEQTCLQNCQAKGGCAGDNCSIPSQPCNPNWWPQCPNTNTNCANSAPPNRDCSGCVCRDIGANLNRCGCRLKP